MQTKGNLGTTSRNINSPVTVELSTSVSQKAKNRSSMWSSSTICGDNLFVQIKLA